MLYESESQTRKHHMDPKQELALVLQEGEDYFSEFKERLSENTAKEMVAFANSSGGRIFLGITDTGVVKGIRDTNKLRSRVQDMAQNCDPSITVSLEKLENVLVVEVDEGTDKPYTCREGFFIRVGPNSQKMKRDEVVEYFNHEGRVRFDEQFCMDFNYPEDFSNPQFLGFLARCHITQNLPEGQFLQNLGLARKHQGRLLMKNVGVLLFAKEPARFHFHAVVTCVRFRGTNKTYIIDRKDFSEDIISNVENAMKWLKTFIPLRYEIGGGKLQRDEIPEIPYDVLREAILNSVVHRDYFEKGAVTMVEFFDDRIHISNPGGLMKGIPPEEFGATSMSRNPLLQGLFLRAELVEKIGSGIGRMQSDLKEHGLQEPEISWNGFFRITFRRPIVTQERREEDEDPIPDTRTGLRIEKILELIASGSIERRPDAEQIFGVSERTAERDLAQLKKNGFIMFKGASKSGRYLVTPEGRNHLNSRREEKS